MKMVWKEETQAANTAGRSVCGVLGCTRYVYGHGRCRDHQEPTKARTCRHKAHLLIKCGCCDRRVCVDCYGPWNALACERCREKTRMLERTQ